MSKALIVYASSIPGIVLDCDIDTGTKIGGGKPTDNAAKFNAVLATATPAKPLHLIIDGGSALGAALVIPQTGHVTLSGLGWGTGFFYLSGSNCHAIQSSNIGTTHLSNFKAIHPPAPHAFAGKNVVLTNFRINHNKGSFPHGVVGPIPDPTDTTLPGIANADAKGTNKYFYVSILMIGMENVTIRDVFVYGSPSYAINLYKCRNILVDGCRLEAANIGESDCTAGVQIEGGCSNCRISNCFIRVGDDAFAFNLFEDPPESGGDFIVSDCVLDGYTLGRVFGMNVQGYDAQTHRVQFHNITGQLRWWGLIVGNGNVYEDKGADTNHSILLDGIDIQFTGTGPTASGLVVVAGNAGLIELNRCKLVDPIQATPLVIMSNLAATVSSLRITNCGIHRSAAGSAAAYAVEAGKAGSTIGDVVISDFHVTQQHAQKYNDIPALVRLGGSAVGSMSVSGRLDGVGTVVSITGGSTLGRLNFPDLTHVSNATHASACSISVSGPTSLPVSVGRFTGINLAGIAASGVTLSGPGILPSGFPVADALMDNNTLYLGSDHQSQPCIKLAGKPHAIGTSPLK